MKLYNRQTVSHDMLASKALLLVACVVGFLDSNGFGAILTSTSVAAESRLLASHLSPMQTRFRDERGQSNDDRQVISGLLDRQLFKLAASMAESRLKDQQPGSVGQSAWMIEWLKVLTAQAASSDRDERASQWQHIDTLARQFAADFSDHPHLVLVRLQAALAKQARAMQIHQELQIELRPASDATQAIELLEALALELQGIERQIDLMIPAAPEQTSDDGRLSRTELQALKVNLNLQLARSNINRAQLLPRGRDFDRADILRRADSQLDNILRATSSDHPLWWEGQLELVAIKRLQGDLATAQATLNELQKQKPPSDFQANLDEEMLQLTLMVGHLDAIAEVLNAVDPKTRYRASYVLLLVQGALKLASGRTDEAQQSYWMQTALQLTKRIEVQHGPYWARQAHLMITRSFGTGAVPTADAQILFRVAAEAERNQQWQDAIQAYDQATELLKDAQQSEQAANARFRAALIVQQLGDHEQAYERFSSLVSENPTGGLAPRANLLSLWNYRQITTALGDRDAMFVQMLDYHLETWPSHESAGQVYLWRAQIQANRNDLPAAYNDLISIRHDHPQIGDAIKQADRWLDRVMLKLDPGSVDRTDFVLDLAGWLESVLSDEPNQLPETWNEPSAQAAILLARLNLQYLLASEKWMAELLHSALESRLHAENSWRSTAAAWLVVALATLPDTETQIERWLGTIAHPRDWSNVMAGLQAQLENSSDESQRALISQRQLMISQMLGKQIERFDERQKVQWALAEAQALELNQQQAAAISLLKDLVANFPDDLSVQLAYAEALSRSDQDNLRNQAIARWRLIAARTPTNSRHWFQAKYHVAKLLLETGKIEEARQFLEFMNRVPPGWDQSELKSDFDDLLKRARRGN